MKDIVGEKFTISGFRPTFGTAVAQYEVRTKFPLYFKIDFNSFYFAYLGCHHCGAWDTQPDLDPLGEPLNGKSALKCDACHRPWPEGSGILHHLTEAQNRTILESWLLRAGCDPFRSVFIAEEMNARMGELKEQFLQDSEVDAQTRLREKEQVLLQSRRKHATPSR